MERTKTVFLMKNKKGQESKYKYRVAFFSMNSLQ